MRQRHKRISILLLLAMVIQIFTPFINNIGYAEGKKTVIDKITVEEGEKLNGKTSYNITGKWSIEDGSKEENDKFTLELPKEFEFNTPQDTLYLNSPDGRVYATGELDREDNKITFTFTKLVQEEENIHGTFWIKGLTTKNVEDDEYQGIIDKDVIIKEGDKEWSTSIEVDTGNIKGNSEGGKYYDFNFRKNAGYDVIYGEDGDIYLEWSIDINTADPDNKYKGNIRIEDTIEGNQEIVEDSFRLEYGEDIRDRKSFDGVDDILGFDEKGEKVTELKLEEKSFILEMKVQGEYNYVLWYKTKISMEDFLKDASEGITSYSNDVDLYHDGKKVESSTGKYDFASMGGTGIGDIPNNSEKGNIKLIKVDEEGNELKGAKFKVERLEKKQVLEGNNWVDKIDVDKEFKYNLKTNENGEADIEQLSSGAYRFTEVEAPDGYLKLEEPIEKIFDFEKVNMIVDNYNMLESNDYSVKIVHDYIRDNVDKKLAKQLMNGESGYKPKDEVLTILKTYLMVQGYDMEKKAFVIKVANKKNTKDLEIKKNWVVDEEHKQDLEDKNIVAEFTVDAYKVGNDGLPIVLNKENEIDEKVIDKIYDTTENGKTNKEYKIEYNGGKNQVIKIEDLPITDSEGNEYIYTVIEKQLEDFKSTGEQQVKLKNESKAEFTNTYKPSSEDKPNPEEGLKLKKVDSEEEETVLQDAEFNLTKLEEIEDRKEESEETPKDSEETPKESEETPKESEETPKDSEQTPKDSEQTPKDSEETPEESEQTPEESEQTPKDPEEVVEKLNEEIVESEQDTDESDIDTEDNKENQEETNDQEVVANNDSNKEDEVVGNNEHNKENEDNEVTEDKTDVIEINGKEYKKLENSSEELITNAEGIAEIKDVKDGLYILEETKAPEGYKKLEEEIIIEIEDGKIEVIKGNEELVKVEDGLTLVVKNEEEPEDEEKPEPEDEEKPEPEDEEKPEPEDEEKPEPEDEEKPEPEEPTKPIIPEPEPVNPIEPEIPKEPEEPEEKPEIPEVPEEEEPEEPEEDVGGVIVEPEEPEVPEEEEPELPEEEEEPEVPEEDVGGVIVDPEEDKEEPVKPEEDVAGVVVDKEEDKVEDKVPALPKTGENSTIFLILGLVFIMTGIILKRKIFA